MIYFLKADIPDGPFKIGYSTNEKSCRRRIAEFTLPWPLKIHTLVEGTLANEKWVHTALAEHRLKREWFAAEPPVFELIKQVSARDWVWPKTPNQKAPKPIVPRVFDLPWPIPSPRQLIAIRGWLGLNQADFGERVGVSLTTINNFEGQQVKASLESKVAIGRYIAELGIKFDDSGSLQLPQ